MPRRRTQGASVSDDSDEADASEAYFSSDESDVDSCFDIKDKPESNNDTDPTDNACIADSVKHSDEADLSWITGEDNADSAKY
jgi:hypothetical protein